MAKTNKNTNNTYPDKQTFHKALALLEAPAIRELSRQLEHAIKNSLYNSYLLPPEDIEELRNDAIVITLQKMADGSFLFQGNAPATYAASVARNLLANRLRKQKQGTTTLKQEDQQPAADLDPEQYFVQKETENALGELLNLLSENCQKVIRLKYYDNLPDREVIERQLTSYTTVDSLKNKRCQCLKKLETIAKNQGLSLDDFIK
jgi:RNA polymerase sigma factor (sigma-70 family)